MKLLLKNQESCIIKGGQTTNYSKLERGTRQGEPLSAYLFILKKKSLNVYNNDFLYTAYTDDTTFFYKMKNLQEKFE